MNKGSGGGATLRNDVLPHLHKTEFCSIKAKRAFVEILCESDEHLCAAKSVVVCFEKCINKMRPSDFKNLIDRRRQSRMYPRSLRWHATELHKKVGLPLDNAVTIPQLALFENELDVKIAVIMYENGDFTVKQCSNKVSDKVIFIYLANNHYHAVVNYKSLFRKHFVCLQCFEIHEVSRKKNQNCPCSETEVKCFVCHRRNCKPSNRITCDECNLTCNSIECYNSHKETPLGNNSARLPLCEKRWKCGKCLKVVDTSKVCKEEHICGYYDCRLCQKHVPHNHLCYLRRKKPKTGSGKFLIFDYETSQNETYECAEGYKPHDRCRNCPENALCDRCKKCQNCMTWSCGKRVHHANLVVCQSFCDKCSKESVTGTSKCANCGDVCSKCSKQKVRPEQCEYGDSHCGLREKVFDGFDASFLFCKWLLCPNHMNTTCIAHNGKSFDFLFILNYCVMEANIKPYCIYAGAKIMYLYVKLFKIRFIDSINFFNMSLKKLPLAFDLKPESELGESVLELRKSDFPHYFNTRENASYIGPYPPLEMYGVDMKSPKEREELIAWHKAQANKTFDLARELVAYCKLDTTILRLACVKFREMFMEISKVVDEDDENNVLGIVDPLSCNITLASAVMNLYRVNFIEEYHTIVTADSPEEKQAIFKSGKWFVNDERIPAAKIVSNTFVASSLPQIPAQGYVRQSRHSMKSILWLEWMANKHSCNIEHARNVGEKRIDCNGGHKYYVDGYCHATRTCFEFLGCRFHFCSFCKTPKNLQDPRTRYSLSQLESIEKMRIAAIEEQGYKVIQINECQYDKELSTNLVMKQFIQQLDVPPRMKIRDAFYGGRTSVFKAYYECVEPGEEIHYLDVVSLYPYINKHMRYPLFHPEIITKDFDYTMKSYFGLGHLKILPPATLYSPILPFRSNGKLVFPLCRTCALMVNHDKCTHSIHERALSGVWCTPEILLALENNYTILHIYEIYNYKSYTQYDPVTQKGGLFASQVNKFLKIKVQNSGFPNWVQNDADKHKYVEDFQQKTGVKLEMEKITQNPALRSISKLSLNSLWGKFGERNNKNVNCFVSSTKELDKILSDESKKLERFHVINDEFLAVEYKKKENFEDENFTTNEVIAAFTSCYGRLELYKYIKHVGQSVLYTDTDSIIFVTKKICNNKHSGPCKPSECYTNYPETGDALGEVCSELKEGVHITHFVSTGPKSYSYKCNNGEEVCKFKGVRYNYQNTQMINFTSVKELLFGGENASITLPKASQFVVAKYDGLVFTTEQQKKLQVTFNKRKLLTNFDSVPFGYLEY